MKALLLLLAASVAYGQASHVDAKFPDVTIYRNSEVDGYYGKALYDAIMASRQETDSHASCVSFIDYTTWSYNPACKITYVDSDQPNPAKNAHPRFPCVGCAVDQNHHPDLPCREAQAETSGDYPYEGSGGTDIGPVYPNGMQGAVTIKTVPEAQAKTKPEVFHQVYDPGSGLQHREIPFCGYSDPGEDCVKLPNGFQLMPSLPFNAMPESKP